MRGHGTIATSGRPLDSSFNEYRRRYATEDRARWPLRQWVLTHPFELRGCLGFDGKLLGAVARLFVDSVLGWYRRRPRKYPRERTESGAVVVAQRASSNQMRLFEEH